MLKENERTACWVRRFGAVSAVTVFALLLGGAYPHGGSSETLQPSARVEPETPDKRYGPNPHYRLTPQIKRIIRLAQRDEESKKRSSGGGTQLNKSAPAKTQKIAPVKKKESAPTRKKTAPVKKSTTPALKKKETAPAKKTVAPVKKDTTPAGKRKEPAPVKKEIAPVKKEPAPVIKKEPAPVKKEIAPVTKEVTPTDPRAPAAPPSEQLQENVEFCAKNPSDPSCAKAGPPPPGGTEAGEASPATEKICAANPKYPGCDKLEAPALGPAPEEAGQVGSICEQNPQLPQCQTQETTQPGVPGGRPGEEEVEEAVEGPPVLPDEEAPPGFTPPGTPAPIPPGPPPSPPADESGETTSGPGPTQTVPVLQCSQGIPYQGECVTQCPEGLFNQTDANYSLLACVEQCPEGQFIEFNRCVTQCGPGYNVQHEGECFPGCPDDLIALDGQCVAICPAGQIIQQNPRQCVTSCPTGLVELDGLCVTVSEHGCPGDQVFDDGQCVAYLDCYQSGRVPYEGECRDDCPGGRPQLGSMCVEECPEAWFEENDQCLSYCPTGSQETEWFCRDCPEGTVYGGGRQCREECAADEVYYDSAGQCGPSCNPETEMSVDGACVVRTEMGYEDFISECADTAEGIDTSQLPPEYSGLTPEQMCQMALDQSCQQGGGDFVGNAAESAACRERPCGEGEENASGQCVAPCPAGIERTSDGQCATPCAQGLEYANGQCVAGCLNGASRDASGQCTASCPEGQYLAAGGSECVANCPQNAIEYQGACVAPCPGGDTLYQGQCRLEGTCPQGTLQATGGHSNVCYDECPTGQVGVNTASGRQCRAQCPPRVEQIDGHCVTPCPWGQALGADGQCSNPCPGDQTHTRGGCRNRCPDGLVMLVDLSSPECITEDQCTHVLENMCVPGPITADDAVGLCVSSGYLSPSTQDQAACEAAVAADCAVKTDPSQGGSIPSYCIEAEETVLAEGPTDGTAPPDGAPPPDESAPPPDETAAPPDGAAPPPDDAAPPSDDAAPPPPPADGETPPPPDEGAPPPVSGGPPVSGEAPAPTAPATGKPEAPPAKPKKPTLAELTKDLPIPLKLPPGKPVAVVIGTGDYQDSDIPTAPQAIGNAAHVVRFLEDDLGLDDTSIITALNATLVELEDIFGKKGDTKGDLRDLVRKKNPSEVIVYVSGRARAADGGKDVLLLPADADPTKPETAISLVRIYNHLAAMGVPRLRLYLDPTFVKDDEVVKVQAGPVIGPAGLLTPRGWIALSGASDNAPVPEDKDRSRTLFTDSLIAGLRGIADTTGEGDGDGTITADELHDFARDQAAAAAKRGGTQPVPRLYGPPKEPLRTY